MNLHPLTQSDNAFQLIEEKIGTCQLFPGTFIIEKEVCIISEFGRTPVREALLKLSSGLLLKTLPRSVIKIAPIDYHETNLALEVRFILERLLIKKVIENSGDFEKNRFGLLGKKIIMLHTQMISTLLQNLTTNLIASLLILRDKLSLRKKSCRCTLWQGVWVSW